MRRSPRLEKLAAQMERRTNLLSSLAGQTIAKTDPESYRTVSYVALETLTSWATFCREYFLSCAYLETRTTGGVAVSHSRAGVVDENSAVAEAMRTLNPNISIAPGTTISPLREPRWRRKDVLLSVFTGFGFSNLPAVIGALSYPTSFFDELPTVRNFFAHRDTGTAVEVASMAYTRYGLPSVAHPVVFVNDVLPAKTDTLLREWISDVQTIALGLCA